MRDVVVRGHLGHSHHKMVEFSILGKVRKRVNKPCILDVQRVDCGLLRILIWSPLGNSLRSQGVEKAGHNFRRRS